MQNLKEAPIGVFDSGVGGLTVAREIMRQIPQERIVYFGDTARVPYGSKSTNTLIRYTRQIIRFLKTRGVKAIVVACNTASAVALEAVRDELDIPIIGVVRPGARVAVEATRNKKIGIIGTETTVNSGMYVKLIQEIEPEAQVIGKACPLFVPLVEEGWFKDEITRSVVQRYLAELKTQQVDTLVLGCTHYPLLKRLIGEEIGEEVILVNPSSSVVKEMKEYLLRHDMQSDAEQGEYEFYVSDSTEKFRQFGQQVLEIENLTVKRINIEKY